ncbi:uncharacterized protein [Chlorocebus sabaeus]|uniref:uncharacterized protein n=1 Tax=Chlorocebus sabaeus TaxID=60711 RepID=UPI003BF981E8
MESKAEWKEQEGQENFCPWRRPTGGPKPDPPAPSQNSLDSCLKTNSSVGKVTLIIPPGLSVSCGQGGTIHMVKGKVEYTSEFIDFGLINDNYFDQGAVLTRLMAVMASSFLRVIPGETDGRIEEKRETSKEERRCVSPSHQARRCWVVPKEALRSLELELSRRSFAGTAPIPEHLWPSYFTELAFLSEESGKTACYPGRCGEGRTRRAGRRAPPPSPEARARVAVTSRATRQPRAPPGRARVAAEHMGPRAERARGGRDEEGRRGAASKDVPRDPPHLPVDFLAERMLADPVTCGDTARSALQKLPNCLPKWLHYFAFPPTMRVPVAANPSPEFGIHVLDLSILIEGQNNGLQIRKPHQEDHPRNPWRLRSSLRLVHLETQDEDPTWGCQRGLKRQNTREESGATTQRHCGKTAAGNVVSPACSTSVHAFPPSGSLA